MINIDSNKAVLLVPMKDIKESFMSGLSSCIDMLKQQGLKRGIRLNNKPAIKFFEMYHAKIGSCLNEDSFQNLVLANFVAGHEKARLTDQNAADWFVKLVGAPVLNLTSIKLDAFTRVSRIIFCKLWAEEKIILPRGVSAVRVPNFRDIEQIVKSSPSNLLYKVMAANPSSGLEFTGAVSDEVRKQARSHWFRLLLSSNWVSPENITREDIRKLIESSIGCKNPPLSRYYVFDFLSYLSEDNHEFRKMYEEVLAETEAERNAVKEKKAQEAKLRRKDYPKRPYSRPANPKPFKKDLDAKEMIKFSLGESDKTLERLIQDCFSTNTMRGRFFQETLDFTTHTVFSELGDKEQALIRLIDTAFKGFIDSKRLQKKGAYQYLLCLLLSYVSVYLPWFIRQTHGNLEKLPTTFNGFSCAYYVAQNEHISALLNEGQKTPIPFFKYLEMLGEKFGWSWGETTYTHLANAQRFFEYVEQLADVIPNADKFKCTITASDIPQTRRRVTTVKKVLPREYFRSFISLLESLDYLVDHINGMADGVNPGVVADKLVSPSYDQLTRQKCWRSIWGTQGPRAPELDLNCLNYTPVVFHGEKYYPLRRILRFYTLTPYRVNGRLEKRLTPHVPRILLLMANTGIRQQHLIWLNKDDFDSAVSSHKSALAPLIVSTDKSHSEWVSIVSRDVIDICKRQREWLDRNETEALKEPMWYGDEEKSRFGKFIPLFRLETSHNSWNVWEETPKIMWILQRFLIDEAGEEDCPELAYWKPRNRSKVPGKLSDHKVSLDNFSREDVDLSWDWQLNSIYTPHGLRAAFVSEHIRFLPPSLIGRYLTGHFSETLVWYYAIMDGEDIGDHQQLLINLLMRNEDSIKGGGAPELAQKITEMNARILQSIEGDPSTAISVHGLFSLASVDDEKNGIGALKAKTHTRLAFNATHICPFNNTCPSEVVEKFGLDKPCSLCPFAIRGAIHLPALNAEKFHKIELTQEYGVKIRTYRKRPKTGVIQGELAEMESEYDRLMRDATALEAIEQHLFHMLNANDDGFIVQDKGSVKKLYENFDLGGTEHLMKRLIDVQCFPDLDTPSLQRKFAYLRRKLLLAKNDDLTGLIEEHEEPEHALLASLLHSMMSTQQLTAKDVYRIAKADISNKLSQAPVLKPIGFGLIAKDKAPSVE